MKIETLLCGDNYIYIIANNKEACVIDPSAADPVLSKVNELGVKLSSILITHHHSDHTAGCSKLTQKTDCNTTGPAGKSLSDGDTVSVAGCDFLVITVPGHTADHVAYYSAQSNAVFTGDALFAGGCGRVFEGTTAEMWHSLDKLRSLPDETSVYCGHDYTVDNLQFSLHCEPANRRIMERLETVSKLAQIGNPTVPSTIEVEKATNPFLRVDVEEFMNATGLKGMSPAEAFAEIRSRKNRY